ncbi:MAG: aldo/keto reductase [Candidatus Latescibacterota bacterium]|nr:aldo/keto reductase [Candidatus Latescibacterota bacterium]
MQTRELGRGGPQVPVIGLGAWPIGGGMGILDEEQSIATVRAAIDTGIILLDTARGYQTSETTLGKALKDGYRERCFLATKVSGNYSRQGIRASMENSLCELGVEYVDLYQVHSWRGELWSMEETMGEMVKLQEEGKTRYLGVSNFNAVQMEEAYEVAPFHSSQPGYNMLDRQIEAADLSYCENRGIGNLAHSPLAKGLLTGRYRAGYQFPEDDERSGRPRFQGELFARYCAIAERLKGIACDKGISLVQMAIAWCLRQPAVSCVLVGAKTPEQVAEHMGAAGVTFSVDELMQIDALLADAPSD